MNLQPVLEIQKVKFFEHPSSCISYFEKKHWTEKAISLIQSFGTLLSYALNKISLRFQHIETQMHSLINAHIPGLFKKRLVICIHGLNNNPTQFKKIVDEMQNYDLSETDIFIPYVLQKGNASLDAMVKPIFKEITKWGKTPGQKELIIIAISNGARIARAIDAKLMKLGNNSTIKTLHLVSIVGACQGSSLVNLANKVGLSGLMSKNISEEMPKGSLRNQRLNQDWLDALSNANGLKREYTFIASPHDWQVTNYDSSLMDVKGPIASYAIVPGHGHNSIVDATASVVAKILLEGVLKP